MLPAEFSDIKCIFWYERIDHNVLLFKLIIRISLDSLNVLQIFCFSFQTFQRGVV